MRLEVLWSDRFVQAGVIVEDAIEPPNDTIMQCIVITRSLRMDIERRLLRLERQNFWLKLLACPLAAAALLAVLMGAAAQNQDAGELVKVKKIQLVDSQGGEVAVIDANGIRYTNKGSQVIADVIVGRTSVTAVRDPKNKDRYVQMSIDADKGMCSFVMKGPRAKKYFQMTDNGTVTDGVD
jgi:hypothetical protein